jgi:hypothetical protein
MIREKFKKDMDVFLTPLFGTWLPKNCNDFYAGGGGYSTDFNDRRLRRIARDLTLEYAHAKNIGSTWYSTPDQFRIASYLSSFLMGYLAKEEFTQAERDGKTGVTMWPEWHYGVLSMYGAHLALNHLLGSKEINLIVVPGIIDYPSTNTELIENMIHIHVFHGHDLFSKFAFKMGHYDESLLNETNIHHVKYYALKMALDSKRISSQNLYKLLQLEASKKI